MEKENKCLYDSYYLSLWEEGYIGVSDGIGFLGTIEGDELRDLYEALKDYFENIDSIKE